MFLYITLLYVGKFIRISALPTLPSNQVGYTFSELTLLHDLRKRPFSPACLFVCFLHSWHIEVSRDRIPATAVTYATVVTIARTLTNCVTAGIPPPKKMTVFCVGKVNKQAHIKNKHLSKVNV